MNPESKIIPLENLNMNVSKEVDKNIDFLKMELNTDNCFDITLLFGPMKPVGLRHPDTLVQPYAVVQLRQDDAKKTLYNIKKTLKFSIF